MKREACDEPFAETVAEEPLALHKRAADMNNLQFVTHEFCAA